MTEYILEIIKILILATVPPIIILYGKEIKNKIDICHNYPFKFKFKDNTIEIGNKKRKRVICRGMYHLYDNKNKFFFSSSINAHNTATGGCVGIETLIYDKKDVDYINRANRMEIDIKLYKAIENPDKLQLGIKPNSSQYMSTRFVRFSTSKLPSFFKK